MTVSALTANDVPGAPTGLHGNGQREQPRSTSTGPSRPTTAAPVSITGYKIEVSLQWHGSPAGADRCDVTANTGNTTTTYSHTGLTAGHHPPLPASRRSTRSAPAPPPAPPTPPPPIDAAHRARPRRPDRPLGNGQRDQHDRPLMDRAGRQRRHRPSPATGSRFRPTGTPSSWSDLECANTGNDHHHLLPHRPRYRRHHPPLPRLGDQLGRHRHRLQHRQPSPTPR